MNKEELKQAIRDIKQDKQASENAFDAFFDGLKYTNTMDSALTLTLPQLCRVNLFYSYNDKTYVCMNADRTLEQGVVTEENFAEWMQEM